MLKLSQMSHRRTRGQKLCIHLWTLLPALLLFCTFPATHAPAADRDIRIGRVLAEDLLHDATLASDQTVSVRRPPLSDVALPPPSPVHLALLAPIYLHRHVLTHQDGDTCTFVPSCSQYGLQAIRRYGPLGVVMASDRLLRCHAGNHGYYPERQGRAYDPLH